MQYPNHSPWIEQLDNTLEYPKLSCHAKSDVVVVWAGISWVSTAYQILTQTDLSVTLLEARKIGRWASGHNAGQVVLYFEKPFQDGVARRIRRVGDDGQSAARDHAREDRIFVDFAPIRNERREIGDRRVVVESGERDRDAQNRERREALQEIDYPPALQSAVDHKTRKEQADQHRARELDRRLMVARRLVEADKEEKARDEDCRIVGH